MKKVFVLVCRSAELTLKPLGSSPYEKDKSLGNLYQTYYLCESVGKLASRNRLSNAYLLDVPRIPSSSN